MHTTFIQHTKSLSTNAGYTTADSINKSSAVKSLLLKIKQQIIGIVQAPSQLPKDVREEMYW